MDASRPCVVVVQRTVLYHRDYEWEQGGPLEGLKPLPLFLLVGGMG